MYCRMFAISSSAKFYPSTVGCSRLWPFLIPDCAVRDCSWTENMWEVDNEEIAREVCGWPTFHATIRGLKKNGMFQKFHLAVLRQDTGKTRASVRQDQAISLLNIEDFIDRANSKAVDVVDFLHMELSTKVYDGEACEIISTVRTV